MRYIETFVGAVQHLRTVYNPGTVQWRMAPDVARQVWHRQKPMRKKIARMLRTNKPGVR